jgi:hypothetical protein
MKTAEAVVCGFEAHRFRSRSWHQVIFAAGLVLGICGAAVVRSETDPRHCDPLLRQDSASTLGYRLRGDRCEGLYAQDVGNTILQIASFTRGDDASDFSGSLPIRWSPIADHPVRLRVLGLERGLHYRMDTLRPAGAASYAWPLDVASALGIEAGEVGVLGWWETEIDGSRRSIHVPVDVSTLEPKIQSGAYEIVLVPGAELEEVYLTLAPLDGAGVPGAPLLDGEPLGWGYYPAGRPLQFPLEVDAAQEGLFLLEVAATLRAGGGATTRFWFRHDLELSG